MRHNEGENLDYDVLRSGWSLQVAEDWDSVFLRYANKGPRDCVVSHNPGQPMFPLSCAGTRPRSNWDTHAHTELLPRSSNFSIFIVNIVIIYITKKIFLRCRAGVRSRNNFLLRAGSRSSQLLKELQRTLRTAKSKPISGLHSRRN
jgi:hypothetical protein